MYDIKKKGFPCIKGTSFQNPNDMSRALSTEII